MGQAALLRAVLSSDGRLKAVFDDNSVLTVEPSGAAFTATLPNGDTVQQMSCYATRRRGWCLFAYSCRILLYIVPG